MSSSKKVLVGLLAAAFTVASAGALPARMTIVTTMVAMAMVVMTIALTKTATAPTTTPRWSTSSR